MNKIEIYIVDTTGKILKTNKRKRHIRNVLCTMAFTTLFYRLLKNEYDKHMMAKEIEEIKSKIGGM